MNNPLLVGITGGIGAGKTTIANVFATLGVPVYDADSKARYLMEHDPLLISKIQSIFGPKAYKKGILNRSWIARQSFGNQSLLNQLNEAVHPQVAKDFSQWIHLQNYPYLMKEAALLFEAGSFKSLDITILVKAPKELRIRRTLSRDAHRNEEEVARIMDQQWDDNRKEKLADVVIDNDETKAILYTLLDLHKKFLSGMKRPAID